MIKKLKLKLKSKDDELHNARMLDEELGFLRHNNAKANNMLKKLEKEKHIEKLLVCAIIVIMVVSLQK